MIEDQDVSPSASAGEPFHLMVFFFRPHTSYDEYDQFQADIRDWIESLGLEIRMYRTDGTHAYGIVGRDSGLITRETITSWVEQRGGYNIRFLDWPALGETVADG